MSKIQTCLVFKCSFLDPVPDGLVFGQCPKSERKSSIFGQKYMSKNGMIKRCLILGQKHLKSGHLDLKSQTECVQFGPKNFEAPTFEIQMCQNPNCQMFAFRWFPIFGHSFFWHFTVYEKWSRLFFPVLDSSRFRHLKLLNHHI